MAHFDVHRNRGYDGYAEKQPAVHGGRQLAAAIMGYKAATSESYVASTEEVVTFNSPRGHSMTRPDLLEQFWPRTATHTQPKQIDHDYDNSPKLKGSPHDHSPHKAFEMAKSPPTRHHPNKYGDQGLTHMVGSPRGSPRKAFDGAKSPPRGHYPNKYGAHLHDDHDSPRSPKYNHMTNGGSPHDSPRKAFHNTGHYPTKHGGGGPHDSPRKNFPDSRGAFSSTYHHDDDDSDDEEEVECRDGVCYPKPKYGGGKGYDDGEEKKKGKGFAAGNYPLQQQHSTDHHHQPRKDPHRASDNYGSHSYNAPAHTKPTTDAYYDPYAAPAPIRTKPDHHDGGRFGGGKSSPLSAMAHWTPFAEGKSETIENTEAQRRYANAPAHSGRRYGAAIDSETAAKKYGGVFVRA